MKRTVMAIFLLFLFLQNAFSVDQTATVSSYAGSVEYRTLSGSWAPVETGMELPLGTTVSTGFRSSLIMNIGTATLTVGPLSRLSINELAQREGVVETELFLQVGRVNADVKKVEGLQNEFTIGSPITTASVRGTVFDFDTKTISVSEGVVFQTDQYRQAQMVWAGESGTGSGSDPLSGGQAGRDFFDSTDTSDVAGPADSSGNSPDSGSGGMSFGTADVTWTFEVSAE